MPEHSRATNRQPKATVWIPSYNHSRFLPVAIESVLNQTYENIEIIVVDDGSTDDSLHIANAYKDRYPSRISVFTHPGHCNRGISATVNLAFEKSTGEYVSGLPSDDVLYPDKIARQVAFLEQHSDIGWVYGGVQYIDQSGKKIPDAFVAFKDISRETNPIEHLIRMNFIPGMTVLARRRCFARTGAHDEALIYSDWHFWIRMLAHCKVGYINQPLVMYRQHRDNTALGSNFEENVRRALTVLTSLRENALEIGGALTSPRTRALISLEESLFSFYLNHKQAAEESFRSAFTLDSSLSEDPSYISQWLKTGWGGYEFAKWAIAWIAVECNETSEKLLRKMSKWLSAREALECRKNGDFKTARSLAARTLISKPYAEDARVLAALLLETVVGVDAMNKVRHAKDRISGKLSNAAYS